MSKVIWTVNLIGVDDALVREPEVIASQFNLHVQSVFSNLDCTNCVPALLPSLSLEIPFLSSKFISYAGLVNVLLNYYKPSPDNILNAFLRQYLLRGFCLSFF